MSAPRTRPHPGPTDDINYFHGTIRTHCAMATVEVAREILGIRPWEN